MKNPESTQRRSKSAARKKVGEGPVVESPVEAVPNKAVEKAVEVVDKVEEPGVDAKVVESPDLARSQLLEKIRRLEETKEGPNLRVGPSLALNLEVGPRIGPNPETVLGPEVARSRLIEKSCRG